MKPHADFTTTQTVPLIAVQPSATPATANHPTDEQLKEAYRQLMDANREHTKRGMAFGRMCYQLQQDHKAQGKAGEGFEAFLKELGIPKTTAYRWIRKHKKRELSATRHEVESERKRRKENVISDDRNVQFEFNLPDGYPRKQWNADVKTLGGANKVRKMFLDEFVPEVRKRAEEKRPSVSVQ